MTTTRIDAINEIYSLFKTTLAAGAASVGIALPEVRYMGRDKETVPPVDKFFVEVSQLTNNERMSAFGIGTRLYTVRGTLYLKLFVPQAGPNNYVKGSKLADELKKGFRPRQTTDSVWYREARVQELMPEKGAYRFNVVVDYTYDERQ